MAPHSSTLDWKIPLTEEPGRLQSMGLQRVRHDWATELIYSLVYFSLHCQKVNFTKGRDFVCFFTAVSTVPRTICVSVEQWHPTPVLLPGKSHVWRSLVGCSPWGCEVSDTTEWLHFHFSLSCIGEGNGNLLQCSCLENPRTGEPGGLPSLGSHRVGHDWSDLAEAAGICINGIIQYVVFCI